ncbi:hypothetical protein MVEN_00079100 [Mycena venus]|uniref:Uncharacterized protein n=1 Tax=Mycena venus TaxID=2733690 RepID=A0A8H6Z420_9AGAR|nr:hypothetical protein MVEN_00079100 [Mycena venus]
MSSGGRFQRRGERIRVLVACGNAGVCALVPPDARVVAGRGPRRGLVAVRVPVAFGLCVVYALEFPVGARDPARPRARRQPPSGEEFFERAINVRRRWTSSRIPRRKGKFGEYHPLSRY